MIDYQKFELSSKRLEEQYVNHQTENPVLSDLDREGIAESVIQRFEVCHDCMWKVLKRYRIEQLGIAEPPNSPKPIFRIAHENLLLRTPVDQWIGYADARTSTSHAYDGKKRQGHV